MAKNGTKSELVEPSLPLLRSPLVHHSDDESEPSVKKQGTSPDLTEFGYRDAYDGGVEFQRHNEATSVEVSLQHASDPTSGCLTVEMVCGG